MGGTLWHLCVFFYLLVSVGRYFSQFAIGRVCRAVGTRFDAGVLFYTVKTSDGNLSILRLLI